MIDLDPSHPEFSMAMELLTLLPMQHPNGFRSASFKSLHHDLGVGTLVLHACIKELRHIGHDVTVHKKPPSACIPRSGWRQAEAAGEEYLRVVYGD